MFIKSQSEVRLHTGRSVHFHPSRFTRPSFRFFEGLVPRLVWFLPSLTLGLPTVFDCPVFGCLHIISGQKLDGGKAWE